MHVVLAQLAPLDKRATLIVYARMYWHLKSQPEPSFSRTAKWISETDNPVPRISEDLKACTTTLTNAMREFRGPLMEVSNPLELRKSEALNITLKPALLATPTNDFLRFELRLAERLRQWVAFGFVAAPTSSAEAGMLEGLLVPILTDSLVLPIAGDVQFALHSEMEALWGVLKEREKSSKQAKTLTKQKKTIHDAFNTSAANSAAAHRQRRTYLRQEIEALISLMRDTPALVAPKICVLLAALSLARSEILWYFRHLALAMQLLPKKAPKEEWHDPRIPDLIRLEHTLAEIVLAQQADVSRYYAEYLCGADCPAMREALDHIKQIGGPAADAAASAVDAICAYEGQATSLLESDGAEALQRIQQGYKQCEYLLSASQSGLGLVKQPLLVLRIASQHAEFVSMLPQLVEECASLTELWYYREHVREAFELHVRGEQPGGIVSAGVYLQLLSEFPLVATRFWPEERDIAGPECVRLANDFLEKCSGISRELLVAIVTRRQAADRQLRERNAFELHQTHKKDWKPPKDYVPPAIPGGESEYGARPALEQLRIAERNIEQLIHALCNLGTIIVHDTEIIPIEYIREMLQNQLTEWLRNAFRVSAEGLMLRPSEIRRRLLVLLDTMALLEHAGTVGLEQLWREVFINEFSVRDCCRIGLSEAPPLVELDFQNRAISGVVSFYGNFFQRIMPSANGLIVYSPTRKGYVSKVMPPDTKSDAMPPLKAEEWCDINELRALASIIGPYGVRVFETWALRYIRSQLIALKEVLITNALSLEEISTCYSRDAKFVEASKRLNSIDKAVLHSINIGHILTFRSLLKEALRGVVQESAPYVATAISAAFDSYPRNTFPEPSLLAMDFLASDYGMELGTADQGFKAVLKTIHQEGDQKMWKLLPVLYSVMFLGNVWREAVYIPALGAYQNNVHLLARVINEVIVGFCSLIITPPDEKQVALFLTQFVEISSMVLLRMARNPPKGEKFRPVDFPSIIVFLDQFVENCPLITRDILEDCIPYTLLRNMFRDIFVARPIEGWRE